MVTATLTTKGQITIPKSVRDSLNLRAGDRVSFAIQEDSEVLLRPITKTVDEVFGRFHDPSGPHKTVKEMKKAVAEKIRFRVRKG